MSDDTWLSPYEILDLYGQTEHWIDRYGVQHQLAEMDTAYLRNVRRHLDRTVPSIALVAGLRFPTPRMLGDQAQFDAEREAMRAVGDLAEWSAHPSTCPLVQAVEAELERRRPKGLLARLGLRRGVR